MDNTKLISQLTKAINGEASAIACYKRLIELAPKQEERKQIEEIREDEIRHLKTFSRIYRQITGTEPSPQITKKCPETYREGLLFAFRDEQESVDFYLDVADQSNNPFIKEAFRRAAADEQNHAVWFLFFITAR